MIKFDTKTDTDMQIDNTIVGTFKGQCSPLKNKLEQIQVKAANV